METPKKIMRNHSPEEGGAVNPWETSFEPESQSMKSTGELPAPTPVGSWLSWRDNSRLSGSHSRSGASSISSVEKRKEPTLGVFSDQWDGGILARQGATAEEERGYPSAAGTWSEWSERNKESQRWTLSHYMGKLCGYVKCSNSNLVTVVIVFLDRFGYSTASGRLWCSIRIPLYGPNHLPLVIMGHLSRLNDVYGPTLNAKKKKVEETIGLLNPMLDLNAYFLQLSR